MVANAGYGSEENYEILESKGVTASVKYNCFHKEQKRKVKSDHFLTQNLFYNKVQDFYVCAMGQRMQKVGSANRISSNGYQSQVSYHQAKRYQGCPLRDLCHQAKTNRRIEVNHRLNELKSKARALQTSEKGLEHPQ